MADKLPTLPGAADAAVLQTTSGLILQQNYYLFLKGLLKRAATAEVVIATTAPIASAIPDGEARDWHNTTTNTTVRAVNIGGVVKTITYT